MRSHEILGVRESAPREEIEKAFLAKCTAVESCRDVLGQIPYTQKLHELERAKEECVAWSEKPAAMRFTERVREVSKTRTSDVRLNAVCFGPCTCADQGCGTCCAECDGTQGDPSLCTSCCGSQTVPIVCDVLIWAPAVIYVGYYVFGFIIGLISDAATKRAQEKQTRIRTRIDELSSQLSSVAQKRRGLEQKLNQESETLAYISAFADTFATLGVRDIAALTRAQEAKAQELRQRIAQYLVQEGTLQAQIDEQKRKL